MKAGLIGRECRWCKSDMNGFPSRQRFCCEKCREESALTYRKQRYDANADRLRKFSRDWYDSHRAEALRRNAEWYKANPEKKTEYSRRRLSKIKTRLENCIRVGVHKGLRKGEKAGRPAFSLLGFSVDDLRLHLERQFTKGMSWENFGKWHIDHIVPLSSFSYQTPEDAQFLAAWALANLRPMWGKDNISKHAKRLYLL